MMRLLGVGCREKKILMLGVKVCTATDSYTIIKVACNHAQNTMFADNYLGSVLFCAALC